MAAMSKHQKENPAEYDAGKLKGESFYERDFTRNRVENYVEKHMIGVKSWAYIHGVFDGFDEAVKSDYKTK